MKPYKLWWADSEGCNCHELSEYDTRIEAEDDVSNAFGEFYNTMCGRSCDLLDGTVSLEYVGYRTIRTWSNLYELLD